MSSSSEDKFKQLAKTPPGMTVLNDGPLLVEKASNESFDLSSILIPLYDIMRHPKTQTPLSMAIYGDWGSGKTSAMRWLEAILKEWKKSDPKPEDGVIVRPVWFYPWKYQEQDDVWRGLISEVILASINVEDATPARVKNAVKKFGGFLGRSFINAVSKVKLKADAGNEAIGGKVVGEVDLSFFKDIAEDFQQTNHPEKGYLNHFESTLQEWIKETITENKERMVIFIDDLDRCMPKVALQVLEALKLYLNIPDLIFVVGVDRNVIDRLVTEHYKDLGLEEEKSKNYLAKMFQVEVTISPTEMQIEHYLQSQLAEMQSRKNDYWNKELVDSQRNIFTDIILELTNRNPREVKRLLNSMLIHGTGYRLNGGKSKTSDGESLFAQGMQTYLVHRIITDRYDKEKFVGTRIGVKFLQEWSKLVIAQKNNAEIETTAKNAADWAKLNRSTGTNLITHYELVKKAINLPSIENSQFESLLTNPDYQSYWEFLEDKELGNLMQIQYPSEIRLEIKYESVDPSSLAIQTAIAGALGVPVEELTEKQFSELTSLHLGFYGLEDISLLSSLTSLRYLDLDNNDKVTDIAAIKSLKMLDTLYLGNTSVRNISSIAALKSLISLNLEGTLVDDLSPLYNLNKLKTIWLNGSKVSSAEVEKLKKQLPHCSVVFENT